MKPAALLLLVLCLVPPAWAQGPPAGSPPVPGMSPPGSPAAEGALPADSLAAPAPAATPAPWPAPAGVTAADTPNDNGGSLTVRWQPVPDTKVYRIERAEPDSAFAEVDVALGTATSYRDEQITPGAPYRYRVVAVGPNGEEGASAETPAAASRPQWFNANLAGVLIAVALFMLMVMYFVRRARSGEQLYIRRIAGLEAVDEAVGRATEMGRPVLYIPGIGYISDIATIAGLDVLGQIAKKTAEYGTKITVPIRDPIVFTVAREVVKGAYTEVGRPDAYDPGSVYFLVEQALAYAAGVAGSMVRDKPAANFFLGYFAGESLILAETGASTGAIQIAGTDQTTQLPFFIVACDYTLIGEELYAASAYISREPLMLGALKGQDWGKFVFVVILVVGTVLSLAAGFDASRILSTTGH